MKFTQLFSKPTKDEVRGADSVNHRLLIKAGYVDQLMAGAYTYLPLGLKVLRNIENIIREEMAKAGGQEILMPALHPKENWEKTGRWDSMDDLFRFTSYYTKKEYALGPTHEEVVSPLAKKFTKSYKDFPFGVFQFQTKFRDELRAKSGILRGREFLMKDYYSFHTSEEDLEKYYDNMKLVYRNVFERLGLGEKTYLTYASGGTFSKYSHEFQTVTEAGEDIIYICEKCKVAINEEIIKDVQGKCPECGNSDLKKQKAAETGNIFQLKNKFTDPFGFTFTDEKGKEKPVLMGAYGLGPTRIMGTIVEVSHDDKGIIWPETVAPFQVHLISLGEDSKDEAEKIYEDLLKKGIEVLWDDRDESFGSKLNDADLLGMPTRVLVSKKTLEKDSVEVKKRAEKEAKLVSTSEISKNL